MATTGKDTETQPKCSYTEDDDVKLFSKVDDYLSKYGKKQDLFIKDIRWTEIAFGNYSEGDVERRWNTLTSKVRRPRAANEILDDAKMISDAERLVKERKREADPDQPKMPKSAYLLFSEEKRQRLAERYPSLGSREIVALLGKNGKNFPKKKRRLEDRKQWEEKEKEDLTFY
ncbi:upstream-binding factor 1-like protein 1 [Montipora capricornis]|uniref:upstream-binding factor 1-like protein 1 n=1 Tax=Montipora capricornis TaxID=246305 RepID=UPI0035F2184D